MLDWRAMASYEGEHDITASNASEPARRRLDVTAFFAQIDADVASSVPDATGMALRALARAFQSVEGHAPELDGAVLQLLEEAADPSARQSQGVTDEFLAGLDRVPKKKLRKEDMCPICNTAFIDDPYPLVVRLPCHSSHIFDLDCITLWLKMHTTCPMDRKELVKKPATPLPPNSEDDEDQGGMYG